MSGAPLKSLLNPLMALLVSVIVGNVIAFAAWTAPRFGTRLGVAGASESIESVRGRIEPRMQLIRDTYGRLGEADADLRSFRDQLTTTSGGSELLGMLGEAGRRVGIEVDNATFQLVNIEELGVIQLGITLPVAGPYDAVRRLLDELFALPVFLVVDGISLQSIAGSTPIDEPGGGAPIRLDLAISVFLEDPELIAATAPTAQLGNRGPGGAREAELLRAAASSDDADEIADALMEQLAALPALPVAPEFLVVHLERLELPTVTAEPTRNLFAVVLPPPPPASVVEVPDELLVEPEVALPVRLLGVLRIEGRWHASLTDDRDLFVAETGDRLPNGVEIIEVGADYADVMFDGERTRLSLEGRNS